jgi:hypothetical protein
LALSKCFCSSGPICSLDALAAGAAIASAVMLLMIALPKSRRTVLGTFVVGMRS